MSSWVACFGGDDGDSEVLLSMEDPTMNEWTWTTQSCRKEVAFVGIARKGVSIDSDLSLMGASRTIKVELK